MTVRRCAPRARFFFITTAVACVICSACGSNDDPGAEAGAAQQVALDVDRATSLDDLADTAAREHGAPGENEVVQLRLRSASSASAESAAAGLRALGFRDVVVE